MVSVSFKNCFSEFLGMFGLIFFGQWFTVLALNEKVDATAVGIALAGLITVFIWLSGERGTGHFNPSISLGFYIAGKTNILITIFNIVSQLVGSILGTIVFEYSSHVLLNQKSNLYGVDIFSGVPRYSSKVGAFSTLFFEFFGTFLLTAFTYALYERKQLHQYAAVVGALYGVMCVAFLEFYCISMNPFRVLAGAFQNGLYYDLLYLIMPSLIGGTIGALFSKHMLDINGKEELTDDLKTE